jgi:hypothetical protein
MIEEHRDVSRRLLTRAIQSKIQNSTITIETHAKVVNNVTSLYTSRILYGKGTAHSLQLLKRSIDPDHHKFELDVSTEPGGGDPCPDLSVYCYRNNSFKSLSFKEDDDSAYFIIFWDSFYVQSVYYLNNLNKIMEEKPIGDVKISIIAISLDEDRDVSQETFQQANWSNIECYWAGPKRFESKSAEILQVTVLPTALWVSCGKILWRGNAWDRMIERDFKFFIDFGRLPPNPSILKEGDVCPSICLYPLAEQEDVAPKIDNKVALMMFWASWSKVSQASIYELSREIAHKSEWKTSVEFIAISLDKNKCFSEDNQNDLWPGVKSLWSGPKGFQSPVPSLFNVEKLPFWVLLKESKIIWIGHPKDKNILQMIDALLHNRPIPVTPALSRRELLSKLELVKLIIQSNPQSPYLHIKSFEYSSSAQYTAEGEKEEASCWVYIRTKDKKGIAVQELRQKLEEVFSETIVIISNNEDKFECQRDCICNGCEII